MDALVAENQSTTFNDNVKNCGTAIATLLGVGDVVVDADLGISSNWVPIAEGLFGMGTFLGTTEGAKTRFQNASNDRDFMQNAMLDRMNAMHLTNLLFQKAMLQRLVNDGRGSR